MLVPSIGEIADTHWNKYANFLCLSFFRGVQDSMIQVKSVLRETDSYQYEEALRMTSALKKMYATKQDEGDRKNMDRRWDKLNF